MILLNENETRVLGCLIEKEITTPEYYPLSLNALVNACNQKSNREPVMALAESGVRTALFDLDRMGLVRTIADARVSKFEHRVRDVLNLRRDEVAVLCLLLLRGPQTSAELRARTERMYSFDDNAAVLATLERLAARLTAGEPEPLTQRMPRQPGSREARWVHLLSGPVDSVVPNEVRSQQTPSAEPATDVIHRLQALEALVHGLQDRVRALEDGASAND